MAGVNSSTSHIAKTIKLFIGGDFPRTESGRSLPVLTAKGKKLYAHLCQASRKDLRNAITAAKAAQAGWESKSAYNRSQILYRMAEMFEGKRAEFIEILTETVGTTAKAAGEIVDRSIDALVYYAGFADKYQQVMGAVNPVSGPHHNFTTCEAVGVVGLIANENFDLPNLVAQISAIICSGNSVVVIMGEKGGATLAPLAEVFATSDLPKGVINLLTGYVSELYKHMGSHMELNSLSYQGSDDKVLGELREMAVGNLKRMVSPSKSPSSLEHLLDFVEYKTVWHPIGY